MPPINLAFVRHRHSSKTHTNLRRSLRGSMRVRSEDSIASCWQWDSTPRTSFLWTKGGCPMKPLIFRLSLYFHALHFLLSFHDLRHRRFRILCPLYHVPLGTWTDSTPWMFLLSLPHLVEALSTTDPQTQASISVNTLRYLKDECFMLLCNDNFNWNQLVILTPV